MDPAHQNRRGFLRLFAATAAFAAIEGSLPPVDGAPQGRPFRGANAVSRSGQINDLAKGIETLTPEDQRLAAMLRTMALPVVRGLVEDRAQRWEKNEANDPNLQTNTTTFVTKAKLANGGTLTVELSSRQWPQGPPERELTIKVSGTDRFLTIRGGGLGEGVRDTRAERQQVDRLFENASARVR